MCDENYAYRDCDGHLAMRFWRPYIYINLLTFLGETADGEADFDRCFNQAAILLHVYIEMVLLYPCHNWLW